MKTNGTMNLTRGLSLIALALMFASCSSGAKGGGSNPNSNNAQSASLPPCQGATAVPGKPGWVQCSDLVSSDGSVRANVREITSEEETSMREQYQRTSLLELPVDGKYNAKIYQISGPKEYANKVFIAPRIFAYSSQDGGSRASPKENADGTMTLSFNVIFVDGLSDKVPGPDGFTSIDLPANFQVQNADDLRNEVAQEFGAKDGLAPLPGCPKRIIIKIADQEYDATASELAVGDNCQIDTPTVVSVTLPKDEAQYMLEEALYDHLVDVQAVYETKVSYPVANISVSFDRHQLYSDLQAELGVKVGWFQSDLRAHITKVMQNQLMKVSIQGDVGDALDKLVQRVIDEFFVPFKPDPSDTANACNASSAVCLRLSYNESDQSDTMNFTWDQSSNDMTGQNYLTWTKLGAIERAKNIGSNDPTCTTDDTKRPTYQHPELCSNFSNKTGLPIETGLTVTAGNLLVIKPNFLVQENRPLTEGSTSRTDNNVCVHQKSVCVDWEQTTNGGGAGRGGDTFGEFADYAIAPHPNACIQWQNQCDQTQDQWVETTTYYVGNPQWQLVDNPVGMLQQLYDGLEARFIWTDSKTGETMQKDCPLGVFPRVGDGESLQVHLENVPTCQPFTGNADETPMLYLVNNISFQEPFTNGQRITRWDGKVLQSPSTESYFPEVRFAGTVSVRGYFYESLSSNEGN